MPLGWDTPYYIGGATTVARQGPAAFIALQGPYDFVYQILEGSIIWAGIPGTTLEIFLPIILAGSITYILAELVLVQLDHRTAVLVALATPGWAAVYRLQADLHANLLAVAIFLIALTMLSKSKSFREPRCILGLALVAVASFTHIESTLFLVAVTIISFVHGSKPFPIRTILVVVACIIPAAVFFAEHVLQLLNSSGGSLAFSNPQPLMFWLTVLGPLLPLSMIGLARTCLRPRSWFEIFAATWGIASLIIGVSQYLSPQAVNFAQRAMILFPTPILAGLGAHLLTNVAPVTKTVKISPKFVKTALVASIFILLAISWPITSISALPDEKVFLTPAQYQQLEWVSANLKFAKTPIFMFNDVDEFAGGLAQLYDSWVSATIGPHMSYLGLTDYIVQLEETPFSNLDSRTVANSFMRQFQDSGVTTRAILLQHPIVVLSSFYRPFPLPNYTAPFYDEVSPGIFVDNATRLAGLGNATLPLYIIFGAHSGTWYGTPAPWAESVYSYTVYESITSTLEASFPFVVQQGGNYTLSLRYLDTRGNNFTVAVDGNIIGTVTYRATQIATTRLFPNVVLLQGSHSLTILVSNQPSLATRQVLLDYLSVSMS